MTAFPDLPQPRNRDAIGPLSAHLDDQAVVWAELLAAPANGSFVRIAAFRGRPPYIKSEWQSSRSPHRGIGVY